MLLESTKLQGLGCCTTQQSTARGQALAYTSRRYKNLGVLPKKLGHQSTDVFFVGKKQPHDYLQEMKRSYDVMMTSFVHDSSFLSVFFSTKIFKQRALM